MAREREGEEGREGVSDCGDMNKTVRPASKETRKREEGRSGYGAWREGTSLSLQEAESSI